MSQFNSKTVKKRRIPSSTTFCFIQALKGLDDAHPQWGRQFTLLSLPIRILISSENTLTHIPWSNVQPRHPTVKLTHEIKYYRRWLQEIQMRESGSETEKGEKSVKNICEWVATMDNWCLMALGTFWKTMWNTPSELFEQRKEITNSQLLWLRLTLELLNTWHRLPYKYVCYWFWRVQELLDLGSWHSVNKELKADAQQLHTSYLYWKRKYTLRRESKLPRAVSPEVQAKVHSQMGEQASSRESCCVIPSRCKFRDYIH